MTQRVLGPSGSKRRKTRLLVLTALTAAAFTVFFVVGSAADNPSGCDFAATGTTESCSAALAPSTFAGGDGNLLTSPTTFGTTDWQNVAGRNTGVDLTSGTTDNSFGQGSKTDDPNITVVTGSIPPNKSDLTRFYEASEFVSANSHNYLYLGWERSNVLGSANFNFEINQKTQPDLTTTGAKTLVRTANDLLVTFDFNNGGGRPVVGLLRWVTSASVPVVTGFATNTCFSANSFPCWGDQVTLNGTNSIGAVNNLDPVTDPFTGVPVPALEFGETAIDLTAANVFPTGTCEAFGSTMITGRSSSSFTAEIKDFIAPVPVNISNCGEVKIIKNTAPRNIDQNFSYTSTIPDPATGSTTPSCSSFDTTPSAFTLNDKSGGNNTEDCTNVPAGNYTVTEGAEPGGFSLKSLTCVATGTGSSGSQDGTTPAKANITLAPNGVVTCTYVNQGTGAITVSKTAKNHNNTPVTGPLAGVTFNVDGGTSKTTGVSGQVCFDGLTIGSHTVNETAAPSGYAIDNSSKSVSVTTAATCSSGTPATVSFTDSPLTNISASATSVLAGATNSTITCKDASNVTVASAASGDPVTASTTNGLTPGTYTCTIVIDP